MSIKLMSRVWERSFTHGQQTVALAFADHAGDDGAHAYPSIALVAWKTGYSVRQVKRIIEELRRMGVLVVVAGHRRGRPTEYRINIDAAPEKPPFAKQRGDIKAPQDNRVAVTSSTVGVTLQARSGDISGPIEPLEPSVNQTHAKEVATNSTFNSTEVAVILCQQNAWSGKTMISALAAAIEFQAKKMPGASMERVGEWLVVAWKDHHLRNAKYAGSAHNFFTQGKYATAGIIAKPTVVNPADVIRRQEQGQYE